MFANMANQEVRGIASSSAKQGMVRNSILGGLPPEEMAILRPYLVRKSFQRGAILSEQRRMIETVGFVEAGLVSLRRLSRDSAVEIAMIGTQGVVGTPALLGISNSLYECVAITAVGLLTIRTDELRAVVGGCPRLEERLSEDIHGLLQTSAQIALCGMRHGLEQRLAGWICNASEALDGLPIPVTQHHLSTALGLRRAGVTEVLIRFEDEELISRSRGALRVRNREVLRQKACGCHWMMASTRPGLFK